MSSNDGTTASYGSKTTHILVFPYPAQGHMLALLDLTHQLATRGIRITILVTPKNVPLLNSLLSAHQNSIECLVLPFPTHPKLPLGIENVKDVGNSGNTAIIASLRKLENDVIQWFESHHSPPQAIISDFFLGFTHHWAAKLKIPRIGFFSVQVILPFLLDYLFLNKYDMFSSDIIEFPSILGSPSFPKDHLPSIFRKYRDDDPDSKIVKESLELNFKAWGCVFNSFYDLEGEHLDHLKTSLKNERVYGVGPISLFDGYKGLKSDSSLNNKAPRHAVLNWLDNCPDESILYVCFGSQKMLTEAQTKALALGLQRSKTRFVWVVKTAGGQDWDIDEYAEKVAGQGLVERGWVPQEEILNHKAVRGFLSHCGWNSTLESIAAGVMVLAWPMEADQFLNARLLVEEVGVAVRLCEGENTVPDPDEVAAIISQSFTKDSPQKDRAKSMRDKAFKAVSVGGSSYVDLEALVEALILLGESRTT